MFNKVLIFLFFASTCFGALPNWHFKDSTPPYWRLGDGTWKMQTGAAAGSDLVLEYLFGVNGDESNITLDTSGNNLTGTVTSATWVEATNGFTYSYQFDNSDDMIERAHIPDADFTVDTLVSVWAKRDNAGNDDPLLSQGNASGDYDGWGLEIQPATADRITFWDGAGWKSVVGNDVNDTDWHHIVIVWTSATDYVSFYTDGVFKGAVSCSSDAEAGTNTFRAGINQWDNRKFGGQMWGVKIDTNASALTAAAIFETNVVQRVQLGTMSQYLEDNRTDYSNCVLNVTHNNQLQDGSKEHNITTTASAPTSAGSSSKGHYNYNGSANYVDTGMAFTMPSNKMTISAWFKIDTYGANDAILAVRGSSYFMMAQGAADELEIWGVWTGYGGTLASQLTNTIPTGVWHNVTWVYDGDEVTDTWVYVDGVEVWSDNFGSGNVSVGNNLIIGNDTGAGGRFFNGDIDDVIILKEAWTGLQATNYYNESKTALGH